MQFLGRLPHTLAVLSLSLAIAGSTGCKNETAIDVDQFLDNWSETICEAVIACSCEYPDGALLDHCEAQLSVAGETLAELNRVEGLSFDGECAQQEIDELGSLGCGVPQFDPDAECEKPCKVWHGPMGTGGTCTSINGYDNCKQGLVCGEGVCVDPCAEADLPKVGELCAPAFGCEEGAYCDSESSPLYPTCALLPGIDDSCVETEFGGYMCAEGLVCDFSDVADPTCLALPGLGDECPDFVCDEGYYCDSSQAPAVCAAPPSLGDDCPLGFCEYPYECDEGGVCVQPEAAVCGYYGGLPDEGGDADGSDTGTDTFDTGTDGTDTFDTGDFDTGTDTFDTGTDTGGCGIDEFTCADGITCIPLSWVCDTYDDCGDLSDEVDCA